jgi:hypothetical protein
MSHNEEVTKGMTRIRGTAPWVLAALAMMFAFAGCAGQESTEQTMEETQPTEVPADTTAMPGDTTAMTN